MMKDVEHGWNSDGFPIFYPASDRALGEVSMWCGPLSIERYHSIFPRFLELSTNKLHVSLKQTPQLSGKMTVAW